MALSPHALQVFPVDPYLPEILERLEAGRNLVVVADPGSGKTTRIPPACLDARWLGGKQVLLLEPRRIAARAAAAFMAAQRGEKAGQTVGYRVRGESRVSSATRLEVVTEGILTRMIQGDAELGSVGMILFDEFHERSIHVDLALALALEVQRALRPDLRLVVMSATIDAEKVAALLGNADIISCPGRVFPVDVRYLAQPVQRYLDQVAADAVRRALREESGDILVFLPGRGEISRVQDRLRGVVEVEEVDVLPLHSEIRGEVQDRILNPRPNDRRRVVLATNIAETSLTIPRVRIVIDSGEMRVPRFNPRRGISGLETVSVSLASAAQRAGRAGRLEPGVCYRLWTEREQATLQPYNTPEILHADLAPLLLELAAWGSINPADFTFMNQPPEAQIRRARELLELLGALNREGKISSHGKELLSSAVHPRLAHLLIVAMSQGLGGPACDLIALLQEPVLSADRDLDQLVSNRFESLQQFRKSGRDRAGALQRVNLEAERLRSMNGLAAVDGAENADAFGRLLALAFPERIAQQREPNSLRYLMRSGTGAVAPERSPLTRHPFLVVADLDGSGSNARIFLAEPVSQSELEEVFADNIESRREVFWDSATGSVRAREVRSLGAILFSERPVAPTDHEALPVLTDFVRQAGITSLPFRQQAGSYRERIVWLRSRGIDHEHLPDLGDQALADSLDDWLTGFLPGVRRLSELGNSSLDDLLAPFLTYQVKQRVDELAPATVTLPSGRVVAIDYQDPQAPALSARLQELFGRSAPLRIVRGAVPLTVTLLSPAGRPLQVTSDLESFWKNSYTEVRKEMQGRYPRHSWPADPLAAQPMRGVKKRS